MNSYHQFEITIDKERKEPMHLHPEVELLYVVEGSVRVKIKDADFELGRDDILVINSSIQHSCETGDKTIVCSIQFDYQILVHLLKKPNGIFWCSSVTDMDKSYIELQSLCREVIYEEVVSNHKTDSLKYSLLYRILDELVENFMLDDTNSEVSENYDADEKLQTIIHYVHQNYQDGISLSDLAQQMYTSTSTLSRLFKKQTGTYFAEYVNQVRTKYAVNELLYTEKNMTRIAMDCGFSNASAFTKVFREIYHMAPTEYRQRVKGERVMPQTVDVDIRRQIEEKYRNRPAPESPREKHTVEVVDVTKVSALHKSWNQMINVGFIHDLCNANVQYHTLYLARELGYQYARIFMVFNTKTMVSDGKSIGNYNFDMIFDVLDFLVGNHIKPWLDFTNRPYANVRNAGDSVWFENICIEYKNRCVWEDLYQDFFKSIVRRYGEKEVSSWRFEIGREEFHESYDRFFEEEGYSFEEVYKFIRRKVREFIPGAEVGYNGCTSNTAEVSLERILKNLAASEYKPDFVSFMLFPYIPIVEEARQEKTGAFIRTKDRHFEEKEVKKIRSLLDRAGLSDTKLVVSEWNLTVSNCNFLNDSCFRGALFLRTVLNQAPDVDTFGLWMCTDWVCNSFNARNVVNGGGGLLTKDTIRKPVYYAVRFLKHLGDELVARGENYIVTKQGSDEYQIICFHLVWYSSSYFINAENQAKVEEVKPYFDMSEGKTLEIELKGVSENGWYYVKRRAVNAEHGSIIDEWEKFNNDSNLERSDIKYLQEICVPELTRTKLQAKKDRLRLSIHMQAEEFCVLHIFPAD